LRVEYLPSIERAVADLSDDQVWWRPNEASNSVGNLILHLTGNVREWILGGVGRLPYERNRQREFDERKAIPKDALLARLRTVLGEADAVLGRVKDAELTEVRKIHDDDISVLQAIYHVVEHFSTHTGQILWIAKSLRR
jgi:uncharacterized damage-inducible protein DinB